MILRLIFVNGDKECTSPSCGDILFLTSCLTRFRVNCWESEGSWSMGIKLSWSCNESVPSMLTNFNKNLFSFCHFHNITIKSC